MATAPTTVRSAMLMEQMNRIDKFIELVFEDEMEHVIACGRVKPTVRDASEEVKRAVVVAHSDLLKALTKRVHELNFSWNIEEGLY